jgi:hypothetical protein
LKALSFVVPQCEILDGGAIVNSYTHDCRQPSCGKGFHLVARATSKARFCACCCMPNDYKSAFYFDKIDGKTIQILSLLILIWLFVPDVCPEYPKPNCNEAKTVHLLQTFYSLDLFDFERTASRTRAQYDVMVERYETLVQLAKDYLNDVDIDGNKCNTMSSLAEGSKKIEASLEFIKKELDGNFISVRPSGLFG